MNIYSLGLISILHIFCIYSNKRCERCGCCKCGKQVDKNERKISRQSFEYAKFKNSRQSFEYAKFKNVKINDFIKEYGLKRYSEFIIQILKDKLGWVIDEDVQGGKYTKYDYKNVKHSKKVKYQRDKQILRWVSTTLSFLYIGDASKNTLNEVQCYLHDNVIYVATNYDKDADKIESKIKNLIKDINDFCEKMTKKIKKEVKNMIKGNNVDKGSNSSEFDASERKVRHVIRLKKELDKNTQDDITKLIRENKFFVIKSKNLKNIPNGLHCERKIFEYLRLNKGLQHLDINKLGGIRRPCSICWVYLFSNEKNNNCGILWDSKETFINTEEDMKIKDIIERIKKIKNTNTPFCVDDQSDDEAD